MAGTLQFELVSPERRLASVEATEVQIPGADGDLTAMADHSPVITTLRPGILKVLSSEGEARYAVTGGFAEITPAATSVLAERAIPVDEMTQDMIDEMVSEAREAHQAAQSGDQGGLVDDAAKVLADMVAMGQEIGLSPKAG